MSHDCHEVCILIVSSNHGQTSLFFPFFLLLLLLLLLHELHRKKGRRLKKILLLASVVAVARTVWDCRGNSSQAWPRYFGLTHLTLLPTLRASIKSLGKNPHKKWMPSRSSLASPLSQYCMKSRKLKRLKGGTVYQNRLRNSSYTLLLCNKTVEKEASRGLCIGLTSVWTLSLWRMTSLWIVFLHVTYNCIVQNTYPNL